MKPDIWIIGTTAIAVDYAKVLKGLGKEFLVIGRGQTNAKSFAGVTGLEPVTGGIENAVTRLGYIPEYVINAVGVENLYHVNKFLIEAGVKNILAEKPGGLSTDEIKLTIELALKKRAHVWVAYNRRFYASVAAAENMIKEDGGVRSFNFEFTEWSHVIEAIKDKSPVVLENWFLANSTHVIDMAFYLGGKPKQFSSYTSGKNDLSWHKGASDFCGAGFSDNGALFSYHADWKAPGRFSVEILTSKHRFIFRPLEKLQIQEIGSVAITMAEKIDYSLDEQFKPGLYLQTKAFLENDHFKLCSISEQLEKMEIYIKMRGF